MNLATLAVKYLTWRLRTDKNFWTTYQANIAMAVYDVLLRETNLDSVVAHKICNEGATNFMNLWCDVKGVGK